MGWWAYPPAAGCSLQDWYWQWVGSVQGCCCWAICIPKLWWRCPCTAAHPRLGSPLGKPCYRFVPVHGHKHQYGYGWMSATPGSCLLRWPVSWYLGGEEWKLAWGCAAPPLCIPICLWSVGSQIAEKTSGARRCTPATACHSHHWPNPHGFVWSIFFKPYNIPSCAYNILQQANVMRGENTSFSDQLSYNFTACSLVFC